MPISVRLYSNDGRSDVLVLGEDARVPALRNAIGDAFLIDDDAARHRIRITLHKPFEERLMAARTSPKAGRRRPVQVPTVLSAEMDATPIKEVGVHHLATLVVDNCDALSNRALYTTIRKIRAMKETGTRSELRAMRLLKTVLGNIVLNPDDGAARRVQAAPVRTALQDAGCYAIIKHLGVVMQGDWFLFDNVRIDHARRVLQNLYATAADWDDIEQAHVGRQTKAVEDSPARPPRFDLRPKPVVVVANALPDYSRYALATIVAVIVAGIVASAWSPAATAPPPTTSAWPTGAPTGPRPEPPATTDASDAMQPRPLHGDHYKPDVAG